MLLEKRFDAGVVELNYVEGPDAGPPLVFLHGISSCWHRFEPAIPALALRWRVVAVDLRGHGTSGRVTGRYGLMEYVHDVLRLLRHLGDESAVVAGHSLGAMIAIGLASEAPSLVRGVVLEDPPLIAFNGQPFDRRPELDQFVDRFVAQRALLRTGPSVGRIVQELRKLTPGQDPVALRYRAHSLSTIDPEVYTPVIENRAVDDFDLSERLPRITCPTLLLQGNAERGGALSDDDAAWAASLIPDCLHVSVPDVGHDILTTSGTRSGYYVDLVTRFLEVVRAGQA